jgi:hypothetical protein
MWSIIEQFGVKENKEVARGPEVGHALRCEFAGGRVRGHN